MFIIIYSQTVGKITKNKMLKKISFFSVITSLFIILTVGKSPAATRFQYNEDTTVADKTTGLIWTYDANLSKVGNCSYNGNWNETFSFVSCLNSTNYLGHNDWRVPSIDELLTILSPEADNSNDNVSAYHYLTNNGFPDVAYNYWSSTEYSSELAWSYDLEFYGKTYTSKTTSGYAVWPVRGQAVIQHIPVPAEQYVWAYDNIISSSGFAFMNRLIKSFDPVLARPIVLIPAGNNSGNAIINPKVGMYRFTAPVDVYFAVSIPSLSETYMLVSDSEFRPFSSELIPWKRNFTGELTMDFGQVPASSLPHGNLILYLAITPPYSLGTYYLWVLSADNP